LSNQTKKLLITTNTFCIVQRETAQQKLGFFRGYSVAEIPSTLQAGWSDCMYFSLSFFRLLAYKPELDCTISHFIE
jgi:hypothetical protein